MLIHFIFSSIYKSSAPRDLRGDQCWMEGIRNLPDSQFFDMLTHVDLGCDFRATTAFDYSLGLLMCSHSYSLHFENVSTAWNIPIRL